MASLSFPSPSFSAFVREIACETLAAALAMVSLVTIDNAARGRRGRRKEGKG